MSDIFVGRQPIFNEDLTIYAYELLFRQSSTATDANVFDGDKATSQVMMNCFVDIGIQNIVGQHKAFINLTEHFLSNPDLIVIPSTQVVLEVLEDVDPSPQVVNALQTLHEKGFIIALDDFVYDDKFKPMMEYASIIKVDLTLESRAEIEANLPKLKQYKCDLLAEKIETYEEFEFFKKLGFKYFQGYFFAKPTIVQGKEIPSNKMVILQLVAKINQPDLDINELTTIITNDVSMSHKILKYINSAASIVRTEVSSIQQAVMLIGIQTIKNWVTVLALSGQAQKPLELSTSALVRARFCQQLAKKNKLPNPDNYFTVGLFSLIDAMLDQPMQDLMSELALSDESKKAIMNYEGSYGEVLKIALALEFMEYQKIQSDNLDLSDLITLYLESFKWADDLLKATT